MGNSKGTVATREAVSFDALVTSPKSFRYLITGAEKLDDSTAQQVAQVGREGSKLELVGTVAQAVALYLLTGTGTYTSDEASKAMGLSLSQARVSQLKAAGNVLVNLGEFSGATAQQVVTAAGRKSGALNKAVGESTIRKAQAAVKTAIAEYAAEQGKTREPSNMGGKGGLKDDTTPGSAKTPKVTTGAPETDGPTVEFQGHVTALVDACAYLSDRADRFTEADGNTVREAMGTLVDALVAQRNNQTAAAH